MPYHNSDPKRDHNFDNHPYGLGEGVIEFIGSLPLQVVLGAVSAWPLRKSRSHGFPILAKEELQFVFFRRSYIEFGCF